VGCNPSRLQFSARKLAVRAAEPAEYIIENKSPLIGQEAPKPCTLIPGDSGAPIVPWYSQAKLLAGGEGCRMHTPHVKACAQQVTIAAR